MAGQDDIEDDGFGETSRYTAHLDRGWSLLDRGDLTQARNSAHQAHRLRPEVPDAAMLMAAIALAEGEPDSALDWYEKAIEIDGEYVEAQLAAAQVLLYDLDDPARAIERAEQARELDEATPLDRLDLGLLELEALVSLGQHEQAQARLAVLPNLGVIEELFDAQTTRERSAELLGSLGWLGDPSELDDVDLPFGRHVQIAVRVAQLHIDLGHPSDALPWLRGLVNRLEHDPELWYLFNEAAFLAGDPVAAAHAALQVLRLDSETELPDWAPEPIAVHQRVVELLLGCSDPELARLVSPESSESILPGREFSDSARPTPPGREFFESTRPSREFVVFINDRTPPELVLEGVDPRVRVLALAARSMALDPEGEPKFDAPSLTGVAVYRRNLIRFARDAETFEQELEFALFDELAAFLGLDDARRERLNLPPRIGYEGVDVASAMPAPPASPGPRRAGMRREPALVLSETHEAPAPTHGRKPDASGRKKVAKKVTKKVAKKVAKKKSQ